MRHLTSLSSLCLTLLPLVAANTGGVTCNNIQIKGQKYDFSALDKPHAVWVVDEDSPPAVYNTTWTVNICSQLKIDKSRELEDQCKAATNICGVRRSWNPVDDPEKKHIEIENVIALAGSFPHEGKPLEHWWTPITASDDHPGGLEFKVDGVKYGKFKQRAFIDFQCDPDANEEEKRDDEDRPKKSEGDVQFVSYDVESEGKNTYETLRLQWKTKYACAGTHWDAGRASSGWGFFTWFIIILFLGIATYLVFGSWLNYNKYGARGWDLLPHGDTIRDIPYLVKDWGKKVVDTVSGPGTRGGYSAV